jgi:hypothetical protein
MPPAFKLTPTIIEREPGVRLSRSAQETLVKKPALSAVGFMESDFVRYVIQDEKGRF